jgi:hypothetical protein
MGNPRGAPSACGVPILLLLGELSALLGSGDVLAHDEVFAAITGAGLVGGIAAVVLVALLPPSDRPQRTSKRRR